jgi:3-oxoacyl-[acyl-carrier protein] reductase
MTGRRVLITGSSQGLGRSLAEHYLQSGDIVIGCARGASNLEHERYAHYPVDVADEGSVRSLFRDVRARYGHLDAVINNAGIASMNPIALTPLPTARRIVETNFLGTFLITHGAIRLLRGSSSGRIVNLSTVAVPLRLEGEAVYAASKSAVETFTRITAREVGTFGITCNAVAPCPARTNLTRNVPEAKMQALVARQAIARWAEPADVANVIDFFLRPESSLVTGQVVYLGGVG